jgi:3-methyladenine DNA glycosylase/8-oxoguanine DNA glycosylase
VTAIMMANHIQKKNRSDNKNNRSITCTRKLLPSVHDRVKLIHIDDVYSGLVHGICGTVCSIYAANEICKSVNRAESIIWVKWDNGVELGLIDVVDTYELL